jgi:hypothetical protein
VLIFAFRPRPERTACSTQTRLITGSMPGMAASMKLTCSFGPAPKPTAAPEKSLDFEATWAWTSRPITSSQAPVRPSISLDCAVLMAFM